MGYTEGQIERECKREIKKEIVREIKKETVREIDREKGAVGYKKEIYGERWSERTR